MKPQPFLWRQLQASAAVLQSVRAGVSATAALDSVESVLRPGVQALTFLALRHLGRALALRQLLASRMPPPAVDALLLLALALIWHDDHAPYDTFTLVNQTVEAANHSSTIKSKAAFINACLRRFLREREALIALTERDPVARWNHPVWWIELLQTQWPDQWQSILTASNAHAPLVLRVNARKITTTAYLALLQNAGVSGQAVGLWGVALEAACAVKMIPGFAEGLVSVQDGAGQMAAPLLLSGCKGTQPPLRVLDACAAPGGKTAHLLEMADVDVTALDVDPKRCELVHQTLQRLGLQARVIAADATDVPSWWDGQLFDAVLLDAPCSASGVVRRHPDIRWLRRPTDIAQLAQTQARLLSVLWPLLKPGGRMLYGTCSVFKVEGDDQIKAFLVNNTDARALDSPGYLLPGPPVEGLADNHDHDGFYYALLEKMAD